MKLLPGLLVVALFFACCLAQVKPNVSICKSSYHTIPETYYAQILDYTGKAVDDMGNYDGCQWLPANLTHYCVAQTAVEIGKANEHVMVFMGICAPLVCSAEMLEDMMFTGLNATRPHVPAKWGGPFDYSLNHLGVTCVERGWQKMTTGAILTMIFFFFIALLVLGGTILEYVDLSMSNNNLSRTAKKVIGPGDDRERASLINEHHHTHGENGNGRISIEEPIIANSLNNGDIGPPKKRPGKFVEFLKCFAIGSNLGFLLKDNRSSEWGLAAMNGLRCLMMFWVILGHTFTYLNTPVGFDNSVLVTQKVIERVSFQVVSAAELAVDVFFYMSGFLVVYMVLKEMKNSKRKIPWGLFYFHRYWRLTPVYGLIILFYTTLTPLMIYGPFSYLYRPMKTDLCDKYWWTNILYINNFYPNNSNDQCFGWGWYLANDMQFFMLTPLIILLFKKSRTAAAVVLFALFTMCLTLDGVLTYHNHLKPLDPGDSNWNSIVYNKPYTRVAPYLIGIAFAFLVQYDHIDLLENWVVRWAVYVLSGTATSCSTYMTYGFWRGTGWEPWQNVLYAVSARCLFVTGTAFFMYACYKGHGGILRSILSVYMWVPIARLTYTAYLVHPIVMFVINYSATTNFHYSAIYAGVRYSAHLLLAYVCGLVFHLAIEKPTANLERLFLPRKH